MSKNFVADKLKIQGNKILSTIGDKTKVAAIAFILVLTTSGMLMAGSVVNAQQRRLLRTRSYLWLLTP